MASRPSPSQQQTPTFRVENSVHASLGFWARKANPNVVAFRARLNDNGGASSQLARAGSQERVNWAGGGFDWKQRDVIMSAPHRDLLHRRATY